MNTTHRPRKSAATLLGLAVAGATATTLLSLGAGIAQAGEFDPQPDPPGQSRGFDPQPEPPASRFDGSDLLPKLNMPPGLKGLVAGR